MKYDTDLAHRFLDLYDQGVLARDVLVARLSQCMVPESVTLIPEVHPEVYRRAMKIWPDE